MTAQSDVSKISMNVYQDVCVPRALRIVSFSHRHLSKAKRYVFLNAMSAMSMPIPASVAMMRYALREVTCMFHSRFLSMPEMPKLHPVSDCRLIAS